MVPSDYPIGTGVMELLKFQVYGILYPLDLQVKRKYRKKVDIMKKKENYIKYFTDNVDEIEFQLIFAKLCLF